MGYHVIVNPGKIPLKRMYVEKLEELVNIEGITSISIVYPGSVENKPEIVGESLVYKCWGEDWFRAGLKAQQLFAQLARKQGWMLEELKQDRESYKAYALYGKEPVKRGDFLIRNLRNVEIEVKCRTFYGKGEQRYFYFSEEDLQKHRNMEKATHTSVIVAVFRRRADKPLADSLCMIKVDRIFELSLTLQPEEKEYGNVYRIPLKETTKGFELLRQYGIEETQPEYKLGEQLTSLYGKNGLPEMEKPYVLVGYYKDEEHLNWILSQRLYNVRIGTDRGSFVQGPREMNVRYLLLHTKGEKITGRLFKIIEEGPKIYPREVLLEKNYPGCPAHDYYLVYKIAPVYEKELAGRTWDISRFEGYRGGRNAAFPFVVAYSQLFENE